MKYICGVCQRARHEACADPDCQCDCHSDPADLTHAERADHLLAEANNLPVGDLEAPEVLAAAQVHATLALVEQRRIANLLAYAQFRWTEPTGGQHSLSVVFPAAMSALQEAGRALGMEQSA